jgi:hypothetical protein
MPIQTVPETSTSYYLVAYDREGNERSEGERLLSDEIVRAVANDPITDVMVLSHGWNGDLPSARTQYDSWIATMLACSADRETAATVAGGFRPLLVGLHWPSLAWGDEELGGSSFAVGGSTTDIEPPTVDVVVDGYADRLSATPAAREAIRTIIEAALVDIAPTTLPPAVREAYQVLDRETGQQALGEGSAPGDDREPFDPERTYQAALLEEQMTTFGGFGLGGLLAPLRMLTFWQMKRRACRFGETGAAELVRRVLASVPEDRVVRLHLMGHSFGCIVVSAGVVGGRADAPVLVDSVALVQGALSLWSYSPDIPVAPGRAGYFHKLFTRQLVRGPTVVTMSEHDRAVGSFYPLGAGIARQVEYVPGELPKYGGIGAFGARGTLPKVEDLAVRRAEEPYDLRGGVVYNVDCSNVIATGSGPSGAHSDICHPEVAHLVWSAMTSAMRVGAAAGERPAHT